ncbi:4-hydroxy-tetrahydrodipicolinate synthase [Sphingomicrobium sediminis]|uniref:4-hydroxy-tetrahydrodipicolinate synthase n=1 Tax=Sphingomicrobium sediminis TaxID=2950949 RepID=A0A9X2EFC5_9SPHN|nr:4-hydroxy-tetrahydrodipicolinate synthase [Sphingomicrobium sediminis]MCM8556948.1 4-hydroxy-tetrahydrodipicolinate synthase [Sphingomicrobium sediminis]
MFKGSIPALVTPFSNGEVDLEAYGELVDWQISEGSHGLVPCGTTGEVATLNAAEHRAVVAKCAEVAAGRVPVIAGCGGYDTAAVIEATKMVAEAGADAALCVVPYYNKPSQAGLIAHFLAIAEASPLPVMVYNVPGRTVADIGVAALGEVAKHEKIVAIKDATGNLGRVTEQRMACGEDFIQLSGDDPTALAFNAMGGVGCVSVTGNVAPGLCAKFQDAMAAGNWDEARALQGKLYPLHVAMFADASPGPCKYALSRVRPGFSTEVRLPLTQPSEAARAAVDAALVHAGLAG